MQEQWYYGHNGERHGPVSLDALKQLAASGQLLPTDLVWKSGMPDWLPAKDIEDLFLQPESVSETVVGEPPLAPQQILSSADSATYQALPVPQMSSRRTLAIGLTVFSICAVLGVSVFFFLHRRGAKTPNEETEVEASDDKTAAETPDDKVKVDQPATFEILNHRTKTQPNDEYYTAHCKHLSLEATRTGKKLEKNIGAGLAGLELKGVSLLEVKVKASPNLGGKSKNVFAGFMVDYRTAQGYTKRVALSLGAFNKDRDARAPLWGKDSVPDDFVDLGRKGSYQLDLQKWAPQGWTGQVWFTLVLQQRAPNTFLMAELALHGVQEGKKTMGQ